MKRNLLLSTILFLWFLTPALVEAQFETATVLGYVHDSSGAVIQDASVTLLNQGKQNQVIVKTNGQGAFEFTDVALGQYAITAQAPGFSTHPTTYAATMTLSTRRSWPVTGPHLLARVAKSYF